MTRHDIIYLWPRKGGAYHMPISPLAGQPAESAALIDPARLIADYYAIHPDPVVAAQRVSFGTSGHRGSASDGSFNEQHILAITQAICAYRQQASIGGPLFLGIDTHILSEPAFAGAVGVLAANGGEARNADSAPGAGRLGGGGLTPAPA